MRKCRLRKYKSKYRSFLFIAKVAMIWYLFVFSITYLTSDTSALFTDEVNPKGKIESGIWPADYELAFIKSNGNENWDVCTYPFEISDSIRNIGNEDMNGAQSYEVYFVENGNPEKGEKVGEGIVEVLEKNEKTELKYLAEKPGTYIFMVKYKTEKQQEVWSKKQIKIDCDSGQDPNKEKDKNKMNSDEDNSEPDVEQLEPINDGNKIIEEKIEVPEVQENIDQKHDTEAPIGEEKVETKATESEEQINEEENLPEPTKEQPIVNQEKEQEFKSITEEEVKQEGEEE